MWTRRESGGSGQAENPYCETFVLPVAGAQNLLLRYPPIPFTLMVFVDGLLQRANGTPWTLSNNVLSLTASPFAPAASQTVTVYYWYYEDATPTGIDWNSPGWKYVTNLPFSDSVNRSATDYNDKDWLVGSAPLGNATYSGIPAATEWVANTQCWIRRSIASAPGATVTISVRVDNLCNVYWNGILVGNAGSETSSYTEATLTVSGSNVQDSNVIAIRAKDDNAVQANDNTYIDCKIAAGF